MGYERRPFNPTTPYPNQVATELNKANDNFDLLSQAFVNDDPTTLKMKNALNSDNAINSTNAVNSDMVDGFNASQTPTPNTIPVALDTGKLDLNWLLASQTPSPNTIPVALDTGKLHIDWLPDDIGGYGYRRIDLTNATTDYNLQLDEEAYYEWNTATTNRSLPLRIQVSGSLYQLFVAPSGYNTSTVFYLNPNNTTYSSQFNEVRIRSEQPNSNTPSCHSTTTNNMRFYSSGAFSVLLQTIMQNKMAITFGFHSSNIFIVSSFWNNNSTTWSSLGTLTVNNNVGTAYVLVRRLL
jgi:hypothetical protein